MAAQGITQDQIDDLREVAPNKMLEDMKKLSQDEGNLEFRDSVGATPLHIAVAQGFEKVVEFLIEAKVDIHAQDEDGWQPIHAAACWAQAEIIHILVEHGADLESKTNNNETPLIDAR
ncbi:hypothetical protein BSL78_12385 [Apostichopus japonicus]|uniref:Uncharacterized protein n=1 Tax=Stichopus japonicus TaxID=307972 RepID=A0A2G8KRV9_STIJA|nr:hypothetical protein BSL78_12385 [Apostichopus japonicus]